MPHATVKLNAGVDQNETPVLNEAGISTSNLIRFIPDRNGIGLVQKLGGWTKYYASQTVAIVRNLLAWEDTNAAKWLAIGTDTYVSNSNPRTQLAVMNAVMNSSGVTTATSLTDITPRVASDDVTVSFSTTSGSSIVTIVDATTTGITAYDAVYIAVQVSVGGLVLYGLYPVVANAGSTSYTIQAVDIFNNPVAASSTVTNGGAAPSITTASGSSVLTVTLANHGYTVGSTFPVLVQTAVGGVTIAPGNYVVQSVTSTSVFTINGPQSAGSTATASVNAGKARFLYSIGVGPQVASTGYGVGGYGIGGYGTGSAVTATQGLPVNATNWSLDNWGQILIASPNNTVSDSVPLTGVYQWDPTSNAPVATIIPQAPPVNEGMFIAMPQRQIILYGSTFTGVQDPLLVRWCDINNFSVWSGQIINQAGSYRIPKGSRIVGGLQGPQQGLLWTDLALWSMQYINQPFVYSFNEIGTGCGLIAKRAAGTMNGIVYWMGQSQFYELGASGVKPIACPVWDVIFQELDGANLDKIRVAPNSRFGEISWFYPTLSSGGEVAAYAKYNVFLDKWDFGTLGRSAWINESVLGPPIGADPSSLYVYQHETSPDADGRPLLASFTTGYFTLSDADVKTFVDQVWPDMKWGYYGGTQNASVSLQFNVVDYPGDPATVYGPFTMTQAVKFITPRFRGRLVQIQISSADVGSWWRIGGIRYRYSPDGKF